MKPVYVLREIDRKGPKFCHKEGFPSMKNRLALSEILSDEINFPCEHFVHCSHVHISVQ